MRKCSENTIQRWGQKLWNKSQMQIIENIVLCDKVNSDLRVQAKQWLKALEEATTEAVRDTMLKNPEQWKKFEQAIAENKLGRAKIGNISSVHWQMLHVMMEIIPLSDMKIIFHDVHQAWETEKLLKGSEEKNMVLINSNFVYELYKESKILRTIIRLIIDERNWRPFQQVIETSINTDYLVHTDNQLRY